MLSESQVFECLSLLQDIRAGRSCVPYYAKIRATWLVDAFEDAMCEIYTSDWIRWHIMDEEFVDDVLRHLRSFLKYSHVTDCDIRTDGFPDQSQIRKENILDHHFWNDCDPFWGTDPLRGRYGKSPGEDILIKLLSNSW